MLLLVCKLEMKEVTCYNLDSFAPNLDKYSEALHLS
jgi:hypothetical protein